jgi:hypothetical protein
MRSKARDRAISACFAAQCPRMRLSIFLKIGSNEIAYRFACGVNRLVPSVIATRQVEGAGSLRRGDGRVGEHRKRADASGELGPAVGRASQVIRDEAERRHATALVEAREGTTVIESPSSWRRRISAASTRSSSNYPMTTSPS